MNLVSVLAMGFLLGMKHATESDHLAAVAALATRQRSWLRTIRQGFAWGAGHTLTLLLVGSAVLALGAAIPPKLDRALELCVGLMLVALGVDVLRRLQRERIHFHVHRHADGEVHFHAHSHARAPHAVRLPLGIRHVPEQLPRIAVTLDRSFESHEHQHVHKLPLRALLVGMMHGLSGSAALVLLSLQTVKSIPLGVVYILIFGLGSIAGMAMLSCAIAVPLRLSTVYLTGLHRSFNAIVGIATVCLGGWMIYRIAIVEGLATAVL